MSKRGVESRHHSRWLCDKPATENRGEVAERLKAAVC